MSLMSEPDRLWGRLRANHGLRFMWILVWMFTMSSVVVNGAHALDITAAESSSWMRGMAVVVASFFPFAGLVMTESVLIMIRSWRVSHWWVTAMQALLVTASLVMLVVAFWRSFNALTEMAVMLSIPATDAWMLPVLTDTGIVVGTIGVVLAEVKMKIDRDAEAEMALDRSETAEKELVLVAQGSAQESAQEPRELESVAVHGAEGVPSHGVSEAVTLAAPAQAQQAVPSHGVPQAVPSHGTDGVPSQRDEAAQGVDQGEQHDVPTVPAEVVPGQGDEDEPTVPAHDGPLGRADLARYSDTPAVPVRLHVVPSAGVPSLDGDTDAEVVPSHGGSTDDGTPGDIAELAEVVVEQFKPDAPAEVVAQMITARRGGASYRDLGTLAGVSANTARRWMLAVNVDVDSESTG